jgi:TrmH family RNA methyltransferase
MRKFRITTENAEYQVIRSLKLNRSKRSRAGEAFVEGTESIRQADNAGVVFTRILFPDKGRRSDWAENLIQRHADARLIEISGDLFRALSDRDSLPEILVTVRTGTKNIDELSLPEKPLVLIFDRPGDMGNFGTMIRSANSFGADAVFILGHAVDPFDPKVIRTSLGSIFHISIVKAGSMDELRSWISRQKRENGLVLTGSDSEGSVSIQDHVFKRPAALVLGNEAKGMSAALREMCDCIVRIPIAGEVNSLNVSCAGSILLWEFFRNSVQ